MKLHVQRIAAIVFCVCFAICLGGCGGQTDSGSSQDQSAADETVRDFYAMDTYMTVTAYGAGAEEGVEKAEAEAHRLDEMLSTGDPDSEISRLNDAGGGTVSPETGDLVRMSLDLYKDTAGTFDIAIYPVMKAWGFADGKYRVPSEDELETLRPLTDAGKIRFDAESKTVEFEQEGMAVDLGGIAKGYASERMISVIRDCGVSSALVNLGGNVQVLGSKPDGSDWRIAIRDPKGDEGYLGVVEASDTAVITSGAYERNFTQDGKLYHHIIDPSDGHPADSGLQSVTIISGNAAEADALATSLYILGRDGALDFWREHKESFDCILFDDAGELYVTQPVADRFSTEGYPVHTIR